MQRAGLRLVERLQRELGERAVAPQVVPQPAQRMRAGQLVGAVGGDDQQRQLAQRQRERAEQLDRGVVGPLQVVEQQRRGPLRRRASARPQRIASTSVARSPLARASPSSGSSTARWPRSGPQRVEAARARTAGTRGTPRRPGRRATRRAWPRRARGARRRRASASSASRVLPTPASPETSSSPPRPAAASSSAARSRANSALAADQHARDSTPGSDRKRAGPGAVEDRRDLGHQVGREAAALGVLEDRPRRSRPRGRSRSCRRRRSCGTTRTGAAGSRRRRWTWR